MMARLLTGCLVCLAFCVGIIAWTLSSTSTSRSAALAGSIKPLGGKKNGAGNNGLGSTSINADQPWDGATDWMGNWAGSWNNTTVQQTYGNGSCSFSKVETFALNFAGRSQTSLSGALVTDLIYGHELVLKDGDGRATKFIIRVCPAPGANYDTSPASHVVRRYKIDVVKSAIAPEKRLLVRVLVGCKLDNQRCPEIWWARTPEAVLKLSGAQRIDYAERGEKPEVHVQFSRAQQAPLR
jgi:hypothetical protein